MHSVSQNVTSQHTIPSREFTQEVVFRPLIHFTTETKFIHVSPLLVDGWLVDGFYLFECGLQILVKNHVSRPHCHLLFIFDARSSQPHYEKKVLITVSCGNFQTVLHWGAKHGNADIIKLFAGTYSADVNAKTNGVSLNYSKLLSNTITPGIRSKYSVAREYKGLGYKPDIPGVETIQDLRFIHAGR